MRRSALLVTAAALVLAAPNLSAQAKANFAGKWTQIVDPNAPPPSGRGGMGGMLGQEATLTQDDKTLTITRTTQMGEVKTVYNLDGSESKNTLNMGGNPVEQISKATWDGNKLVITTSSSFNGNAFTTTVAMSLDANGVLTVQATAPGRGGGDPVTTTRTYKKS